MKHQPFAVLLGKKQVLRATVLNFEQFFQLFGGQPEISLCNVGRFDGMFFQVARNFTF